MKWEEKGEQDLCPTCAPQLGARAPEPLFDTRPFDPNDLGTWFSFWGQTQSSS